MNVKIKETTETAASSSYLDCYLYIDNGKLTTRLYSVLFYTNTLDLLPPKPKLSLRYLKQGIQEFRVKYVFVQIANFMPYGY